jgi:hypothetical protein
MKFKKNFKGHFLVLVICLIALRGISQISIYTDPRMEFIKLGRYEEKKYSMKIYKTEINSQRQYADRERVTWFSTLPLKNLADTSNFINFSNVQKINDTLSIVYNHKIVDTKETVSKEFVDGTTNLDFFRVVTVGRGSTDVNYSGVSAAGGSIFCFSGGEKKQWDLGVGFDLGKITDTIAFEDFRLNNLFVNGGRSVISAYISLDILRTNKIQEKAKENTKQGKKKLGLLEKVSRYSLSHVMPANKMDFDNRISKFGMQWMSTCPTLEFQYKSSRTVFNNVPIPAYQSETVQFMAGLKHWWRYQNETNRMGFLFYPNIKYVHLFNYKGDFLSTQFPNQVSNGIYNKIFIGAIMGVQYNELLFTINYNQTKRVVMDNQNFGGSIFSVGVAFNLNVLSL